MRTPLNSMIMTLTLCLLVGSSRSYSADPKPTNTFVTLESGLQYQILKAPQDAKSPRPRQDQLVLIHYTAWFQCNNRKFDSSIDHDKPYEIQLGLGRTIRGVEEGIRLMRVGEKRRFIIPPHLGYGKFGDGWTVPANMTLIYEIELIEIREAPDKPQQVSAP